MAQFPCLNQIVINFQKRRSRGGNDSRVRVLQMNCVELRKLAILSSIQGNVHYLTRSWVTYSDNELSLSHSHKYFILINKIDEGIVR